VGRPRRDRSPAVGRSVAHHRDSGGNNGPNGPNGGSICSGNGSTNHGSTNHDAAHRHRRACWG